MNEPLRRTVRVHCPLAHAFHVFTAQLDLWWPKGHRRFENSRLLLDAHVGGRFVERSDTGEEANLGQVLHCEPPHRITYTWHPGSISNPTEVNVQFTDHGDHTLVEVTHFEGASGLGAAWPQRVQIFTKAWTHVLTALAAFVDAQTPV